MLELNPKQRQEQTLRDELRILAVQIETINQQLAAGTPGGGPALGKAFSDVNQKLSFLYEFLKTSQAEFRADAKTNLEQVQTSVNSTLHKNLGDIYAAQQETQRAVANIRTVGGGANQQDLEDIKKTLRELVTVYREEVEIFRKQNEFLQKKLVDIEVRLQNLEK